jgi:predicted lipoprotein with Yx(FWY)xxD motif
MFERNQIRHLPVLGSLLALAMVAAACTSGATTAPVTQTATPTAAASSAASASASASAGESPSASAGGSPSASAAGEAYEVKVATDATVGKFLTGEDGKTLYTFKSDTENKSACTGGCATAWPPFTIAGPDTLKAGDGVTGTLTTFDRGDGTKQVSYNGKPLYYYANDAKAGDVTGQGVGGKWFVAAP